jgi:hypothetical protein
LKVKSSDSEGVCDILVSVTSVPTQQIERVMLLEVCAAGGSQFVLCTSRIVAICRVSVIVTKGLQAFYPGVLGVL